MVVRVEYDRSNRVCIRRTSNKPSHAVAQGSNFSIGVRSPSPSPPPPAGAGAVSHSRNVFFCFYVAMRCCSRLDAEQLANKADDVHMRLYGDEAYKLKPLVEAILEHKQWASSFECRYCDFASCVEQRCCKYSSCKYKHKYLTIRHEMLF